jgi:hypothetical protein
MHVTSPANVKPEPRMPFAGTVPPTPAEHAIASERWERRGPLRRLVRLG